MLRNRVVAATTCAGATPLSRGSHGLGLAWPREALHRSAFMYTESLLYGSLLGDSYGDERELYVSTVGQSAFKRFGGVKATHRGSRWGGDP